MIHTARTILLAAVGVLLASCASGTEPDPANVDVALDSAEPQAPYTNGAGWTVNAYAPAFQGSQIIGTMTLSGPGGATPAGLCILQSVWTPCSSDDAAGDAECGGGPWRCLRSDNSGPAYCHLQVACSSGNRTAGTYQVYAQGWWGNHYTVNACYGGACAGGRSTSPTMEMPYFDNDWQ